MKKTTKTALFLVALSSLITPKTHTLPSFNANVFRSFLSELNKKIDNIIDPQTETLKLNYYQAAQEIFSTELPTLHAAMPIKTGLTELTAAISELAHRAKIIKETRDYLAQNPHLMPPLEPLLILTKTERLLLGKFDELSNINANLSSEFLTMQNTLNAAKYLYIQQNIEFETSTAISRFLQSIIQPLEEKVRSKYNEIVFAYNEQFAYQPTEQTNTEQITENINQQNNSAETDSITSLQYFSPETVGSYLLNN